MSGYVLYGYAQSGSAVIEAALVDAGIAFEFKNLNNDKGDLQGAAYRALNPRQQVPALMHPDGSVITEIPAILNHLADAFPDSGLAPTPGSSARAQHDRWLAFLHANIYEAVLRVYYSERYTDDLAGTDGIRRAAKAYIIRHFSLFGDAISQGPFLFGDHPTGVDYLAWVLTTWMDPELMASANPQVASLGRAMAARPKLADVVARNRIVF
ncbi:MAG: glutathione S-transferase family protein [Roseovarius sp.]|nr:glutathione S-transferase family protein [Roseovarius sp.]